MKEKFEIAKNKIGKVFGAVKGFIAPVFLGSVLALFGGTKSCTYERGREAKIPLGFSEISQIERDAIKEGRVSAESEDQDDSKGMSRTYFQAGLNDLLMKIFECWNNANFRDGEIYKNFAGNLEDRFNPEKREHHYELCDLFEIVPESSRNLRKQLKNFIRVRDFGPEIIEEFNKAWTEKHKDNYHTVYYPAIETYTDSKGRMHTRTVIKSKQVYDNSEHWFDYYKEHGEKASKLSEELAKSIESIRLREELKTASKTDKEGERAAVESRKENGEEKTFTNDELKEIADMWYLGSTITMNEQAVYIIWPRVTQDFIDWNEAKKTASSMYYKDLKTRHPGPTEFQVARKARGDYKELLNYVNETISVIDYTDQKIPELRNKISLFIDFSRDEDKNYKKQGINVLNLSKEIYEKNFKKGFEVDRFRPGMIALWTFLTGSVGLAGGIGLNYLIQKNKIY